MRPSRCDRTQSLLSQQLDVAISDVERRAVTRHLARCADCRAFDAQSRWVTEELRAAPLLDLPHAFAVAPVRARRITSRLVGNVASVAALIAVGIGGWATGMSLPTGPSGNQAVPPLRESVNGDALRALHVEALRAGQLPMLPATRSPASVKPPRSADDT
jgi:predicted anti-sigma-YlaC factor YlaD